MPIIPGREEDFMFRSQYIAAVLDYWDNTDQSRVDHAFLASADLKFSNDVALKISDNFQKTADPPNSELTGLEKRIRNVSEVVVGYVMDKISCDLGYQNIRDDYNTLNNLDKYGHVITATVYYAVSPKTSVLGEYSFGETIYDNSSTNSDSLYHEYRLGVKGDIAPKLTGTAKAGYRTTDYKDAGKANFTGFTVFLNLAYNIQQRTVINVSAERSTEDSTYSTNSYFEYNKIGLKIDHELLDRLFLMSDAYFQFNKYPEQTTEGSVTDKREDTLWSEAVGLRYEIKDWVSLETKYEYKQRDSEFSTFDYKDNRFTTKVNLTF